MSLLNAIRAGVAVANTITKPLQTTVIYEHCTGDDKYGPTYGPKISLVAIVDMKTQQVRTREGLLSTSRCQVTFLDVAAVVAATGVDGRIRDIDLITLPDGTGGAILSVGGFVDAGTGTPVATDVWL